MLKIKRKAIAACMVGISTLVFSGGALASNDVSTMNEISEVKDIKVSFENGGIVIEVNNEEQEREVIKAIAENNKRVQKIREERLRESEGNKDNNINLNNSRVVEAASSTNEYYSKNIAYRFRYSLLSSVSLNANLRGYTAEDSFGVKKFSSIEGFYLNSANDGSSVSDLTYDTKIIDLSRVCAVTGSSFVNVKGALSDSSHFFEFYIEYNADGTYYIG